MQFAERSSPGSARDSRAPRGDSPSGLLPASKVRDGESPSPARESRALPGFLRNA